MKRSTFYVGLVLCVGSLGAGCASAPTTNEGRLSSAQALEDRAHVERLEREHDASNASAERTNLSLGQLSGEECAQLISHLQDFIRFASSTPEERVLLLNGRSPAELLSAVERSLVELRASSENNETLSEIDRLLSEYRLSLISTENALQRSTSAAELERQTRMATELEARRRSEYEVRIREIESGDERS